MSIEERIAELIDKYEHEANRNQSEADLRADYIDLLFLALGWNVYNNPGELTNYRREGYIRGAGYVDVGLEIAGQPALILEAKKFGALPSSVERIAFDRTPEEKQLFRYARGKKIPYCVLTNFECLHVFNADHERLVLAFDNPAQYLDRLFELLHLSPEKIKAGSLPASERQLEIKEIDETFLGSLQGWRELLANAIYQHNCTNPTLQTDREFDFVKLMEAVQRILDRLILIRYADDREVLLTYDVVEGMLSGYRKKGSYARPDELMRELMDFSHRMDEHHNTTLFQAGHICERVTIPNEVLDKVMTEMNNISFRKFTSDVLGNTYETYLGTKLVMKNGEIRSEERRDIRKAGGIFYTPPAIVHHIVNSTLGRLISEFENESGLHAIERVKKIKVLDPACGSGSFLIYAYRVLADFYRRINEVIENERLRLLTTSGTTDMFERVELFRQLPEPLSDYPRHILENQLYGVDVDPEAAEIAAVDLTMQAFADTRRDKLPLILNENIKVGNSLISGTEETLRKYFGANYHDKRPFNWEQEFDEIMQGGGFDIVVSNPPYVQLSMDPALEPGLKEYLLETFGFSMGRLNTFGFFMQRGGNLLKQHGFLSYIIPNTFLTQEYYRELRKFLLDNCQVVAIATLEEMPFRGAIVENVIAVLKKESSKETRESNVVSIVTLGRDEQRQVPQSIFSNNYNYTFTIHLYGDLNAIRNKIEKLSTKLGNLLNVNQAIALKHDRASCLFKVTHGEEYKKVLDGRDISRYAIHWPGNFLLYDVEKIHSCRREDIFLADEKILFRRVGDRIIAALDTERHYALNTLVVVTPKVEQVNLKFILTLLNSKLLNWYYMLFLKSTKKVFSEIQARQIKQLPVRQINFDSPTDKALHDSLVSLADKVLDLNKRLASFGDATSKEKDEISNEISQTTDEIDERVYELYVITEKEKQVIETTLGTNHRI
jgi:adenine-specific DNA-methyltransferase